MTIVDINLAKKEDLPSIEELFEPSKLDLLKKEIFQWDDHYPNKE